MTTETKPVHAPLSPSARHRWGVCPASVRVSLQYEERKAGPAAIDGTHSHTLLEYCIKNLRPPKEMIGQEMIDHEGAFAVDEDRAERVAVAYEYVMSRALGDYQVFAEQTVNPAALVKRDDMSGTVDVQIHEPGLLEIIDYKDGMTPTDAREQMEQYAIGAMAASLANPNPPFMFERVRLTVIQPKLVFQGMNPITSVELTVDELLFQILPKLITEGRATDDPNAPYVPGEKQCRYCPHRANCSASFSHAMETAGVKFEDLSSPEPAESMSDEQLRKVIEAVPLLNAMIKAIEDEALNRFQAGKPIAGLKMVRNPGRRSWAYDEEEIAAKLSRMKVPKDMIWRTSLISPAQTDKLKWTNRKGEEISLTERQRKVLETDMIKKSDGSLAVVPEADRRTAVEVVDIREAFVPQLPSWMS